MGGMTTLLWLVECETDMKIQKGPTKRCEGKRGPEERSVWEAEVRPGQKGGKGICFFKSISKSLAEVEVGCFNSIHI